MRLLLLGQNGQVGFELRRALAPLGELVAYDHTGCDLASADAIRRAIAETNPDVIINAAAYTAVDKAESEAELAHAINAVAPGLIGAEAKRIDARVIHYSTDYVFDGSKAGPYREDDVTHPLCVYGETKRDGELALVASGAGHYIFRTSWVFGAHGGNFVKTILRLGGERETLKVVADQFGAPTSAALIADMTAQVIGQLRYRDAAAMPSGIYHLTAAGETSWHGFAQAIAHGAAARGRQLRLRPEAIAAIPASEYPLPAKRPANSRLDTTRLQQTFNLAPPPWQAGLDHVLDLII